MNTDAEVVNFLADIERADKELLALFSTIIASGGPVSYQHLYLFGIARRSLAQSNAFRQMIESRNSLVALSLVRMQLDNMLRLYASFFVANPDDFATKVHDGVEIRKIKDAKGNLMTDSYLRDRVTKINAWVNDVYKETSGYIHFSNRHIQAALELKDKATGHVEVQIGPYDLNQPLAYYGEVVRAFRHITMMIPVAAEDWLSQLKINPGKIIGALPKLSEPFPF
jgi:hypothetical protein